MNATAITYEEIARRGNRRLSSGDMSLLESCILREPPAAMQTIVEIGAADGCSSMLFGLLARDIPGAHVWSIDPKVRQRWIANMVDLALEDTVTHIKAFSPCHDGEHYTIRKPIDFLFIDGDHKTRWVLVDYHCWEPLVRAGGLIAFHDWTGANGIAAFIRRAVEIILETDPLIEVGRFEGSDKGTIIFRKPEKAKK